MPRTKAFTLFPIFRRWWRAEVTHNVSMLLVYAVNPRNIEIRGVIYSHFTCVLGQKGGNFRRQNPRSGGYLKMSGWAWEHITGAHLSTRPVVRDDLYLIWTTIIWCMVVQLTTTASKPFLKIENRMNIKKVRALLVFICLSMLVPLQLKLYPQK